VALTVGAPLPGRAVPLASVPDPVFAGAMVGPGLAVEPDDDARVVVSPVDGVLFKVKPHAFVVTADGGRAVLVHLGIDTVKLAGDGFEILAAEGSAVRAGEQVIRWDPGAVRGAGLSACCPVIALETTAVAAAASGRVEAGAPLFIWD